MEKIDGVTSIIKNIIEDIFFITILFLIIAFCFEFFWERDVLIFHKYLNDFFVLKLDINTGYFYKDIFNFISMVIKKISFILVICVVCLSLIRLFCTLDSDIFDFYWKKTASSMLSFSSFGILFDSFINITYKGYFLPSISDAFRWRISCTNYWVVGFFFIALICVIYCDSKDTYRRENNERAK